MGGADEIIRYFIFFSRNVKAWVNKTKKGENSASKCWQFTFSRHITGTQMGRCTEDRVKYLNKLEFDLSYHYKSYYYKYDCHNHYQATVLTIRFEKCREQKLMGTSFTVFARQRLQQIRSTNKRKVSPPHPIKNHMHIFIACKKAILTNVIPVNKRRALSPLNGQRSITDTNRMGRGINLPVASTKK
jgi:hypothetical protein